MVLPGAVAPSDATVWIWRKFKYGCRKIEMAAQERAG